MQKIFTYWHIYSLFRRILVILFLSLLGLFLAVYFILKIPSVQNWVAHKATSILSEKLNTEVTLDEVSINIFNHLILKGLYIEDQQKDTLLYAGKLEINIGIINPFTKNAKLKNISLTDSYINLYSTLPDSTFNFEFIAEAFSSGSKDTTTTELKKGGSTYQVSLNKITIDRTRFKMFDEVGASAIDLYINESEIFINKIDLDKSVLALEKIEFDETVFKLTALYDTIPSDKEESYDTIHIELGAWDIEATQLILSNCGFSFKDDNSSGNPDGINFSDLELTELNIDMSDIIYSGDTILTTINRISLKDKSGFQLDTLAANVIFSAYEVTLSDLLIATPHSSIKDQFGFSYTTLNDFDRFETDVRMNADFKNSTISNSDLAFFVPQLKEYDITLGLSARIYGTLSNIKARDFDAVINDIGGIKGTLDIKGLPNIDETFLDLKLDPLYADMRALDALLGSNTIPKNLLTLGNVNYIGRVTGFAYNLVAYGDINTDQGGIYSDINFTYDPKIKLSSFSGNLNTTALNVGVIAGSPEMLGKVSMDANVHGSIASDNTAEFDVDASINSIEFNKYTYSNIDVDGELKNNSFKGNFAVDDPNIVMTFNGVVDFTDSLPVYNFKSTISRANLMQLNFYDQPIVFSATASMNTKGSSIDDMVGSANFGDLLLIREKYIYRLDTLVINSNYIENKKVIDVKSTLINFNISGDYAITALPSAIKNMVGHYTTGKSDSLISVQKAEYTLTVKNADRLMAIFYPDIQIVRNLTVSGNFNTGINEFNTRVRVDELEYKSMHFDTLLFEARTEGKALGFFARLNSTQINEDTRIPIIRAEGTFARNELNYNLKVGKDTDEDRINLNGAIKFEDSLMAFNILPSEIYFQNEKWDIQPNNSLQYVNKNIIADNFTLNSGDKLISLTSSADDKFNTVLKLKVTNIPIGELAEAYILPGEEVSGNLDASYTIGNLLTKPSFIGGAEIKALTLNGVLLGDLKVNTSLIQPSYKLKFNSTLSGDNGFTTDGYYIFSETDSIVLEANLRRTKLLIVEPFLRGILSELNGDITGKLNIEGPVTRPEMRGSLTVKDGEANIDYLGVNYYFPELKINIDKNKIEVPKSIIHDKLNNTGTLEGEITYSNFNNWNFKKFQLLSDNILLMESTAKENPDFNGYVIGKVDANITGKLDALNISVVATPHAKTLVNLPTYGSGNIKKHDFIRFVDRGDTNQIKTIDELNLAIVTIDLKLNVTPDAQIKILLNSEGTEFLLGRGYGVLNIQANSLGKVEIFGDYRITEGLYDFSFQGLFNRPFTVVPGSTIKFKGDPLKAELDLSAQYTAKKVAISTLTATSSQETTDVNVLILVTGTLDAPNLNFDLDIPESAASNNSDFQRRIQEIESDKNELNKQVFGLLITTSFLPQDLTTYNPVGVTATSTLNDFVSSQITTYFQNVLSDFLKNTEIDIGYDNIQTGSYNFTDEQGKQFDVAVKREINENIIVKVGTTYYDFASGGTSSASSLAGDFEVEYLITDDGRIRVKAFRISEYDAIIAKNDVKTGVGIYYTKDFDKVKELFQRKKE